MNCKNCIYFNNACTIGRRAINDCCNAYSSRDLKNLKYVPGKFKDDIGKPHEHRCIVCGQTFIVPNIEDWAYAHVLNNPLFTKRNERTNLLCSYTCMLRYREVVDPEANINVRTFDPTLYDYNGNLVKKKEDKHENKA